MAYDTVSKLSLQRKGIGEYIAELALLYVFLLCVALSQILGLMASLGLKASREFGCPILSIFYFEAACTRRSFAGICIACMDDFWDRSDSWCDHGL